MLLWICSNTFITIAWYGHLKHPPSPLPAVVAVSWLLAFFECCFELPADRIGYSEYTLVPLKVIQEVSHYAFLSVRLGCISGKN
jgi:uncharacterized protein